MQGEEFICGTVSSTLLVIDETGKIHVWERLYDQTTDLMQEDDHSFTVC